MADFLLNLAVCAGAVLVLLGAVFAVSVRRDRHDLIDVAWGMGFALIAVVSLLLSPDPHLLIAVLTVVWGVRLAVHIGARNLGRPEDPRYVAIRRKAKGGPNLHLARVVYLTQGAIMLFVSLPVQVAQYVPAPPAWLVAAGSAVWLVGFVFEAVGDWQLSRFKADPASRGRLMTTGLWRYTRHPNYFGDAAVWTGLYLLACGSWAGAATIGSPVVMVWLLAGGSGKPMTEKHMRQSRPEYADYVARTSGFLPLPPKTPREYFWELERAKPLMTTLTSRAWSRCREWFCAF
jgi:steroid 5-alpha reductase family enzyme